MKMRPSLVGPIPITQEWLDDVVIPGADQVCERLRAELGDPVTVTGAVRWDTGPYGRAFPEPEWRKP